jgi:hypothetical protein
MTQTDARRIVEEAGFRAVRVGSETVRGPLGWSTLLRTAPTRKVKQFVEALRDEPSMPQWSPWAYESARSVPVSDTPTRGEDGDGDRVRRLRLARAREREDANAPIGPSAAHWRALRVALEKICRLGAYRSLGESLQLPSFEFTWDHPFIRAEANGATCFMPDGSIAVSVKSIGRAPEDVHRTALHEFVHVLDYRLVDVLPDSVLEQRAELVSDQLALLPWRD